MSLRRATAAGVAAGRGTEAGTAAGRGTGTGGAAGAGVAIGGTTGTITTITDGIGLAPGIEAGLGGTGTGGAAGADHGTTAAASSSCHRALETQLRSRHVHYPFIRGFYIRGQEERGSWRNASEKWHGPCVSEAGPPSSESGVSWGLQEGGKGARNTSSGMLQVEKRPRSSTTEVAGQGGPPRCRVGEKSTKEVLPSSKKPSRCFFFSVCRRMEAKEIG